MIFYYDICVTSKGGFVMYRKVTRFLKAWKDSKHRKPLILLGATIPYYLAAHTTKMWRILILK